VSRVKFLVDVAVKTNTLSSIGDGSLSYGCFWLPISANKFQTPGCLSLNFRLSNRDPMKVGWKFQAQDGLRSMPPVLEKVFSVSGSISGLAPN
jgi:hypothetical protein